MAVRRVRRIIRKVDPWTVLKASFVFNAIVGLVFVLGMWVMWSLVLQKGIPEKIVNLFEAVTITLTIDGQLYFRITVILAIIGVIGMTAFMTLAAVIYNLISDLVGGIEVAVLEESYGTGQQAPPPRQVGMAALPAAFGEPETTGTGHANASLHSRAARTLEPGPRGGTRFDRPHSNRPQWVG